MKVKKIGERKKKMVPLKRAALKFISAFLRKKYPESFKRNSSQTSFGFKRRKIEAKKCFSSKFMIILKESNGF